jgi:oxygen-independent coproporphyrinogen-3 oxidase
LYEQLIAVMAGIYIHVPFCKRRCHYCNFYSMASDRHMPFFMDVLLEEIRLQKEYLEGQPISTIYFGGGTPSLLSADEINVIIDEIEQHFKLGEDTEITLEANPDDVNSQWVRNIANTAVNRISMGVQSFHDDDLHYLNRIHNAAEAEAAIMRIQDGGISKLTIDLIYGIPGLTIEKWEQNLEKFFALEVPHLSAYALTVEEKTPLHIKITKGEMKAPDEMSVIDHFKSLIRLTAAHDYIHYEISNFALEGQHSKHNSIYWSGGHYLGLGPSAHSFNGISRRWNKSSLKAWLDLKNYYDESFEEEILTVDQRYNEYVMTSLRTMWGCDTMLVKEEFGENYHTHLLAEAQNYIEAGKIEYKNMRLFLTQRGKLFADGIASDLFI